MNSMKKQRQKEGWEETCKGRKTDRQTEQQTDNQNNGQTDRWMDSQTNRQVDRWIIGQMNRWIDGQMEQQKYKKTVNKKTERQ